MLTMAKPLYSTSFARKMYKKERLVVSHNILVLIKQFKMVS